MKTLLQFGGEPVIRNFERVLVLARSDAFLCPKLPPGLLDGFIVGRDGGNGFPSAFTVVGDIADKVLIFITRVELVRIVCQARLAIVMVATVRVHEGRNIQIEWPLWLPAPSFFSPPRPFSKSNSGLDMLD